MGSRARMEELIAEVDQKNVHNRAIQRNYEALSRTLQIKQRQLEELQLKVQAEQENSNSLAVKLQTTLKRLEATESKLGDLKRLRTENERLKASLREAREAALVASSTVRVDDEQLKALENELQLAQFERKQVDATVAALRKQLASRDGEKKGQAAALEDADRQRRAVESELKAAKDQLKAAQDDLFKAHRSLSAAERTAADWRGRATMSDTRARRADAALAEAKSLAKAGEVAAAAAEAQRRLLESQLRTAGRAAELAAVEADSLRVRLRGAEEGIETVTAEAQDAKAARVAAESALVDADARFEALLNEASVKGSSIAELGNALTQTRALLADAQRAAKAREEDHKSALAEANDAASVLQDKLFKERALRAEANHSHHEALTVVNERVGSLLGALERTETRFAAAIADIARNHDQVSMALSGRLRGWERELQNFDNAIAGVAEQLAAFGRTIKRQDSLRSGSAADAARLGAALRDVEAQLAAAHRAQGALRTEMKRAAEDHEREVLALRAAADADLKAEQRLLESKVAALEKDIAAVRAQWESDRSASAALLRMEQEAFENREAIFTADLNKARGELDEHKRKITGQLRTINQEHMIAVKALEDKLAQKENALDGALKELEAKRNEVAQAEAAALETGVNIQETFKIAASLKGDLAAVDEHMGSMGVAPARYGGKDPPAGDEGRGVQLQSMVMATRLHFAYVTENVQELVKKYRRMAQAA